MLFCTMVTAQENTVDYVNLYRNFLSENSSAMQQERSGFTFSDAYIIDGENDGKPELVVLYNSTMFTGYESDIYEYRDSTIVKMKNEEFSDYRYQNTGGQRLRHGCAILQDDNQKFYFMAYDHMVGDTITYQLYEISDGQKNVIYEGTDLGKITSEYHIILDDIFMIGYDFTDQTKFKFGSDLDRYYKSSLPTEISVVVDGKAIAFDQPPIVENNRTLVPMRAIFEAIGAEIFWNESTQTVTATKGSTTIVIQIGNNIMTKNGGEIALDIPAKLINSRTLVPVRAISEAFGATVKWDEENNTVLITSTSENNTLKERYKDYFNNNIKSKNVTVTPLVFNNQTNLFENGSEKMLDSENIIECGLYKIDSQNTNNLQMLVHYQKECMSDMGEYNDEAWCIYDNNNGNIELKYVFSAELMEDISVYNINDNIVFCNSFFHSQGGYWAYSQYEDGEMKIKTVLKRYWIVSGSTQPNDGAVYFSGLDVSDAYALIKDGENMTDKESVRKFIEEKSQFVTAKAESDIMIPLKDDVR